MNNEVDVDAPDWDLISGLDSWEAWIPTDLRRLWPDMTSESRHAAYRVADEAARTFVERCHGDDD